MDLTPKSYGTVASFLLQNACTKGTFSTSTHSHHLLLQVLAEQNTHIVNIKHLLCNMLPLVSNTASSTLRGRHLPGTFCSNPISLYRACLFLYSILSADLKNQQ